MNRQKPRVAVIGGGASGMMAALAAAKQGASVLLLERQARLGRKLAATGNGRCNLSNENAVPTHYHGRDPSFPVGALERETTEITMHRFAELGLLTVTEPNGRIYPMSDTAGSVVDVLRFGLEAAGVEQRCGCRVQALEKKGKTFLLRWEGGSAPADRVIVACGGKAGGKLGGVEDGYRLLRALGHSCTPLQPALVQLRTEGTLTKALKGIRATAHVSVLRGESCVAETTGEVQFAEYGLSGPAIFELSRAALEAGNTCISLDLFPGMKEAALTQHLQKRIQNMPKLTLEELFTGTVQNRLGRMIVKYSGLSLADRLSSILPLQVEMLSDCAKHFRFTVVGDLGFDNAQVTSGGMNTNKFNSITFESLLCPGLYACGEVLDVDGDCGGYNLQWAWASGWLAGTHAAGGMER